MRACEVCNEARDERNVKKLGPRLFLSMRIGLETRFATARAFFEGVVMAGDTLADSCVVAEECRRGI